MPFFYNVKGFANVPSTLENSRGDEKKTLQGFCHPSQGPIESSL